MAPSGADRGLAVLAPWLSAHRFICVKHEIVLSYLLLFSSFGAVCLYWVQAGRKGFNVWRVLLALTVSSVGLAAMLKVVGTANSRFVAEKFAMISPGEWRQIISAVEQLQEEAMAQNTEQIPRKNPPASFQKLGRTEEYFGGLVVTINNETVSHVRYTGGRYRKWGVCIGPDHLLDRALRRSFKRYPIREGAYFFCGDDT